jgi:CheY-like chemotaxis protein
MSRGTDAPASRRVLIVEDNPDGCEMLRLLLELYGYQVEEAADGRQGVEKALAWRPASPAERDARGRGRAMLPSRTTVCGQGPLRPAYRCQRRPVAQHWMKLPPRTAELAGFSCPSLVNFPC